MRSDYSIIFREEVLQALTELCCADEQAIRWYVKGVAFTASLGQQEPGVVRAVVRGMAVICVVDPHRSVLHVFRVTPAPIEAAEESSSRVFRPMWQQRSPFAPPPSRGEAVVLAFPANPDSRC